MKNHLHRLIKINSALFVSQITSLSKASVQSESAESEQAESKRDKPSVCQLSGHPIWLKKNQIKPEHVSSNPAFYLCADLRAPCSPVFRCKVQEFSHEQLSEFAIGFVFNQIAGHSPQPRLLQAPRKIVALSALDTDRYMCFDYKNTTNLRDFVINKKIDCLSMEEKIRLFSQLIAWVRIDIALNKQIHAPNYLITPQLQVISVDHESAGDYLLNFDAKMPSARDCVQLLFGPLPQEHVNWLESSLFEKILHQHSNKLLLSFASFRDFDVLTQKARQNFADTYDEQDLQKTLETIHKAQLTISVWLNQ